MKRIISALLLAAVMAFGMCACGSKATVNARLDASGTILTTGSQVFLGGNDSYVAMCHRCWRKKIQAQQKSNLN